MNNNNAAGYGGVGLVGLLGVVFVVLKLCNVIDWSWWWVTCPFWIPVAIGTLVLIAAVATSTIRYMIHKRRHRRYTQ